MAEEMEKKGVDNPQPPQDANIAPKPNGVQNAAPALAGQADGPEASTDTDAQPAAAEEPAVPDTAGSDRKIRTLQDFLDRTEPPETEEQRKKRERREKSAKIVSAISDGIQAISNLYFTSQYAPNMYNHEKGSGLNAQSAAIERARKEREANGDRYLKIALALGDAENERAKTVREAEAEQERRKLARAKAQREQEAAERAAALFPDQQTEQKGKADKAVYEAQSAQAKAGKAEELAQAEVDAKRAQGDSYRASAAAHGRANREVTHHFRGKVYPQGTNDYEKDVREAARQYNRRHGKWVEETDNQGNTKRRWVYDEGFQPIVTDRVERTAYGERVKPRKAEEYAGEVETALAREAEESKRRGKGAGYGGDNGKGAGYGG